MKVNVTQTDIKMYSLVVSIIIPRNWSVNVWIQANVKGFYPPKITQVGLSPLNTE